MKVGIKITEDEVFLDAISPKEEYGFTILEIDDKYADCKPLDFDFEPVAFNVEKYKARKQSELASLYEEMIIAKIRERYTIDQELATLRQRDTKPDEFTEYNSYVEQCKAEAKEELKNGN